MFLSTTKGRDTPALKLGYPGPALSYRFSVLSVVVVVELLEVLSAAIEEPLLVLRLLLGFTFGKWRQVRFESLQLFSNGLLAVAFPGARPKALTPRPSQRPTPEGGRGNARRFPQLRP